MVEWACRTYGWGLEYVLHGVSAVRLAMLWRCHAQGVGGLETSTLLSEMVSDIVQAAMAKGEYPNGEQSE